MNGNGWKTWVLVVVGMLASAGVGGAIRTAIAQSAAEARIINVEERQKIRERTVVEQLEKIDDKLDRIIEKIIKQEVEDARSHHTHAK